MTHWKLMKDVAATNPRKAKTFGPAGQQTRSEWCVLCSETMLRPARVPGEEALLRCQPQTSPVISLVTLPSINLILSRPQPSIQLALFYIYEIWGVEFRMKTSPVVIAHRMDHRDCRTRSVWDGQGQCEACGGQWSGGGRRDTTALHSPAPAWRAGPTSPVPAFYPTTPHPTLQFSSPQV